MYFPLKLFFDAKGHCLSVTDNTEQMSGSSELFLEELRSNLELITRAARERFFLVNHSSILSQYFESSLGAWKVVGKSRASHSSLASMMRLVQFLKEKGSIQFPELFREKGTSGRKVIEEVQQILNHLIETECVQGSRKRKAFTPVHVSTLAKRTLIDEPSLEAPSSSVAMSAPIIAETSTSRAPSFVSLLAEAIQLFEPEGYQGPESEDEEVDASEKTVPGIAAEIVVGEVPLPVQPIPLASTMPSTSNEKISHSKEAKTQKTVNSVYPVLCIGKLTTAGYTGYSMEYTTRLSSIKPAKARSRTHKTLKINLVYLKKILSAKDKDKVVIKWKDPFSELSNLRIIDLKEACLKIFQATKACEFYYRQYPEFFKPSTEGDPQSIISETINELEVFLKKDPSISLDAVLEKNISDVTSQTPLQIINRLVQEQKELLDNPKVVLATEGLSAVQCFTYMFTIHQASGSSMSKRFAIKYLELNSRSGFNNLVLRCRRTLKNTLAHIDTVLQVPLSQIKYTPPGENEGGCITMFEELLKILLTGLKENYLYITQCTSSILDSQTQNKLINDLKKTIEKLKAKYVEVSSSDDYDDKRVSIIPALVKTKEGLGVVSLSNVLCKKITKTVLMEPWIFSISPLPMSVCENHYKLSYEQHTIRSRYDKGESFYTTCCLSIMGTLNFVRNFLDRLPEKVFFKDPFAFTFLLVINEKDFWPLILNGLTEMQLFYTTHLPELLQGEQYPTLGEEINQLIEDILEKKSEFCPHPVTKLTILPRLMGIPFFSREKRYTEDLALRDHNYAQ